MVVSKRGTAHEGDGADRGPELTDVVWLLSGEYSGRGHGVLHYGQDTGAEAQIIDGAWLGREGQGWQLHPPRILPPLGALSSREWCSPGVGGFPEHNAGRRITLNCICYQPPTGC